MFAYVSNRIQRNIRWTIQNWCYESRFRMGKWSFEIWDAIGVEKELPLWKRRASPDWVNDMLASESKSFTL
jgi:hypothetical protein